MWNSGFCAALPGIPILLEEREEAQLLRRVHQLPPSVTSGTHWWCSNCGPYPAEEDEKEGGRGTWSGLEKSLSQTSSSAVVKLCLSNSQMIPHLPWRDRCEQSCLRLSLRSRQDVWGESAYITIHGWAWGNGPPRSSDQALDSCSLEVGMAWWTKGRQAS